MQIYNNKICTQQTFCFVYVEFYAVLIVQQLYGSINNGLISNHTLGYHNYTS